MTQQNPLIDSLIAEFKDRKWKSDPMEKALALAVSEPDQIVNLALSIMKELPKGGTYLGVAIAFLPEGDWPELVRQAVAHLKADSDNEAAGSVLLYASLQCVQALHPFLSELFLMVDEFQSFNRGCAWRESGTLSLDFLSRYLDAEPDAVTPQSKYFRADYKDPRYRAFKALLETRHPDCLARACAAIPALFTPELLY